MIGFHNTYLKKLYSNNFETNALQPINVTASENVIPTIELNPELKFVVSVSSTTLLTVPDDKECFLKSLLINGNETTTPSTNSISIRDDLNQLKVTRLFLGTGQTSAIQINFPGKGLKLNPGSSVNCTIASTNAQAGIIYYLGSDRS